MQTRISFDDREEIDLVQPINLEKLQNTIKCYCHKLCHREEVALNAYDLIEAELDLEQAVDIINGNDLADCEKELTNIIRPRIIVFIEYYAFAVEEAESKL